MKNKNTLKKYLQNRLFIFSIVFGYFIYFIIYRFGSGGSFPSAFNDNDYLLYQVSYFSFLKSEWNIPLFLTDRLFVNRSVNLYLADYIPLYSLILKTIYTFFNLKITNPFLFWILLNTILMFYFSLKIFNLNPYFSIYQSYLGAIIISTLTLSPFKFLYHPGEASHWIIIAAIYFFIKSKNNTNYINYLTVFTGITLWIHFYLFTMILGILIISYLINISKIKKILFSFLLLVSLISIIFFLTFGNFETFISTLNTDISSDFNPGWSSEFNSFFCSYYDKSFFHEILKCYEPYTNIDIESYGYLSLGIIFLIPLLFLNFKKMTKLIIFDKNLILLSLVYLFYSFGNRVKIAHKQVYEYEFSNLHLWTIEIFRAHGRFIYLFYYLLCFLCIFNIFNIVQINKKTNIILFIFVFLQIFDLGNQYNYTNLKNFKIEIPENEVLKFVPNSYEYADRTLFIYPPDNCKEDYDMYLFAKEFVKYGGKLSSSRIRGGVNFDNCKNLNILDSLIKYNPSHFIISNPAAKDSYFEINKKYNCIEINGIFQKNFFYYCQKNK